MNKRPGVHPYEMNIRCIIETHKRVLNEYRVWLFKKGYAFTSDYIVEYLVDVGFNPEVIDLDKYRHVYTINGVRYTRHEYRVMRNCHLSCIMKAIKLREQELET